MEKITDLLQRIDTRAREDGITAIGLKGAALHALGVYDIGDRLMADVDLGPAAGGAAHVCSNRSAILNLTVLAGTWTFVPSAESRCAAFGEHYDNPVKIDFHERIAKSCRIA